MQRLPLILLLMFLSGIGIYSQTLHFQNHNLPKTFFQKETSTLYRKSNDELILLHASKIDSYDGQHTHPQFEHDHKSPISAIYQFNDTTLIGHENGDIYIDIKGKKPKLWSIPEGLPRSKITGFIKEKNKLYIATYGEGLYIHDGNHLYNIDQSDGLSSIDIYDIVATNNEGILTATDKGIFLCNLTGEIKKVTHLISTETTLDPIIINLAYNSKGNVHFAQSYEGEIFKIDLKAKELKSIIAKDHTLLGVTESNAYFFDQKKNNIIKFNITTDNSLILKPNGLKQNPELINAIIDDEERLWLLCKNNGLVSAFLPFEYYESGIKAIQKVLINKDDILIGAESGLYIAPISNINAVRKLSSSNVITIEKIQDKFWIGTYDNGVEIFDANFNKIKTSQLNSALSNKTVFDIIQYDNYVWLATLAGIIKCYDSNSISKIYSRQNGLQAEYIYTMHINKGGELLAGTDGQGVWIYKRPQDSFIQLIKNSTIISITNNKNELWAATLTNGLLKLDSNKLSSINLPYELAGIHTDHFENIISIHNNGLSIWSPKYKSLIDITQHLGIETWNQSINAHYEDLKGNLWLPNDNKILVYSPYDISKSYPNLIIRSCELGGETIVDNQQYSHDKNNLLVDYSGIWMQDISALRYQYRLTGQDSIWRTTEDERIIFSNLPPGQYTLQIRCMLGDQIMHKSLYSVSFGISKALWQQWWFWILVSSISIFLGNHFIKAKRKRELLMESLKLEKLKSELDVLKSQISPHFLFNSFNTLISTIEIAPSKAVVFVEHMSDFYRNVLHYRNEDWIKLETELKILKNYIYMLRQRFGDTIEIKIDIDNVEKYSIIPLTLQVLIENAVKHNTATKTMPLQINIFIENDKLVVTNNLNKRKSVDDSTHFGLSSLSQRYSVLTGQPLIIENNHNQFIINIPLKHD